MEAQQRSGRLLLAASFFPLLIWGLSFPVYSTDTWFYLKAGETIWERKGFPVCDLFGLGTQERPWPRSAWGFSVLCHLLWRAGGAAALVLAKLLAAAAAFLILFRLAARRGGDAVACLPLAILCLLATQYLWTERPQTASFLLFACGLAFLAAPPGLGRTACLFLLSACWGNLHDTSIFFAAFCGLHEAGRLLLRRASRREALAAFGASLAGLPFNPAFFQGLWRVGAWYLGADYKSLIWEWQAPAWATHPWFFVLLAAAGLLCLAGLKREERWHEWICLAGLAALSLHTMRFIPFFSLAAAAWLPARLAHLPARPLLALAAALAATLAFLRDPALLRPGMPRGVFPEGAAAYLERRGPPAALANVRWHGDYLHWRLGPRTKVFIDSRLDLVYPLSRLWQETDLFLAKPHWREILDHWGLDTVVVPLRPKALPLYEVLRREKNWTLEYEDDVSAVFRLIKKDGRGKRPSL